MNTERSSNLPQYPQEPKLVGHEPGVLIKPPSVYELSSNPVILDETHPTIQALRQAGDTRNIAVLIDEAQYQADLTNIASQVEAVIDSTNLPIFFCYIAKGGRLLHQEMSEKINTPPIVPPPPDYETKTDPNTTSGFIQIKGTKDSQLLEDRTIIKGFEGYDIAGKHLIIFEDLLDNNLSVQTAINDAIKHGAAQITIVVRNNKIDSETSTKDPNYKPKVILSAQKDGQPIPFKLIIGSSVPRKDWIGGGGADYLKGNIGRNDKFIGALV